MKLRKLICILVPLLLLTVGLGLCFGSVRLTAAQLADALLGTGQSSHRLILWDVRLPRVLAGVLAGVGLSTAGALMQTVTANELASPNIIGINSGAGLTVILMLTFVPAAGAWLPVGAFLGAFGAAAVILAAAGRIGSSRTGILLIGIAITTLLNAVISFLTLLDEGILAQYNHFTVGSLKGIALSELIVPAILILAALIAAMVLSSRPW